MSGVSRTDLSVHRHSSPRRDPATSRWLVRFGYDGSELAGWARQPGSRTVEGVLRDGLRRSRVVPALDALRLEVASRTDRGVSARANALALTLDLPGPVVLRVLNGVAPELYFSAATRVPTGFLVRRALRRVYRYYEPGIGTDLTHWQAGAALFRGRVDVRSFGRGVPSSAPCWREVEEVRLVPAALGLTVEVRAPSFVWGMVRKIVGSLRELDRGHLSLDRLERAIAGRERLTLPLAEPEGLVLWEVQYLGTRWEVRWNGPNRHQEAWARRAREGLWRRKKVLQQLFPPPRRPDPPRATDGPGEGRRPSGTSRRG